MSGMVHLSSIPDDFFVFDPQRSTLTGKQTRRVISLGDNVKVQIHRVDRTKKQVDFRLTNGDKPSPAPKPRAGSSDHRGQDRPQRRSGPPRREISKGQPPASKDREPQRDKKGPSRQRRRR
jgi:ribonuclease R